MLLAVDPGVNRPGAALFLDSKLIAAGCVRVTVKGGCSDAARWLGIARDIKTWALHHGAGTVQPVDRIVFERPFIYPKSRARPNDLICLAGVGTAVAALMLEHCPYLELTSPLPREWTGNISKVCPSCGGKKSKACEDCHGSAWETPRGRRIRSRLSDAEFACSPDQNDAIDAVGLGLYTLKRLAPVSVFSNGR